MIVVISLIVGVVLMFNFRKILEWFRNRKATTKSVPVSKPAPVPKPAPSPVLTPIPTPAPLPTPVPTGKVLWGAYDSRGISSFEYEVGKPVDIVATFYGWGDRFPAAANKNKQLLIFWEQIGTTLDRIISGADDAIIKSFAQGAKVYGGPVLLAPFHEMNGNWVPWWTSTPSKLIQAWRHVVDVFGDVPNVKWVWAVNNGSVPNLASNSIDKFYPGDEYVDIVGIDGFNFGNPWQSPAQCFDKPIAIVKQYGKPIYITSTACMEGTAKAAWITDLYSSYIFKNGISGVVWFNENKERNWLINSDAASLEAFKRGIGGYND